MASFPSLAPISPPETGASTDQQFVSRAEAKISRAKAGWLVVMSTVTELGLRPARTPVGPRTTDLTSDGCPTIVKTTSASWASSSGEEASTTPWDCRGRVLDGVREKTVTE